MKSITLNDVINHELKDKEFAVEYQRELLINAIAKMINQLRCSNKLTQAQLAKSIGTSQSVIARLEGGNDTRVPSLELLARIAMATHSRLNISFELDDD
jgi:DNA-binding XRE family transcriptional regulator